MHIVELDHKELGLAKKTCVLKTGQEGRIMSILLCLLFQLSKIDSLPKPDEMTMEMYAYYFPEKAINPQRPTFWPHIPKMQPGHPDSHLI